MKTESTHFGDKKQALSSSSADFSVPDIILPHQSALLSTYQAFLARLINKNTKQTYANGIELFLSHLTQFGVSELVDVEPKHISKFVSWMNESGYGVATSRLYMSALRMFLDQCVVDGLIAVNPAKAVKLPRQSTKTGKTPVIVPEQVRQILDAIPLTSQADFRDRALIGLMVFSFFRISAALSLKLRDYELRGTERWLIGEEKGSKRHEMPVHPSLELFLDDYIGYCGLEDPATPLFQSSTARGGKLTGRKFDRTAAWRMIRRRAKAAEVFRDIGNHSFRATGITAYLNAGGSIEDARIMANHSNATTTKLYDRTGDKVKVQELGRIKI